MNMARMNERRMNKAVQKPFLEEKAFGSSSASS